MDISVIIVNYNVRDFLKNALVSVFKALADLEGEVFVVDNASDDGSCDMVRQSFPQVHLISNSLNVGFAKANNQALVRAGGKYLMLLNPDTIVQEDTFQTLIKFFKENSDVGMAGCKILNPDGSFQLACRRSFPTPWVAFTKVSGLSSVFGSTKLFGKYNLTYLNPDESYEVDAVSGSCMMMRREVYQSIGGLDEDFFMYGEDLDWCYRVQKSGWKVFYVADTKIIHYKGESTRRSDIDELKIFYKAMRLFVRKHHQGSLIFESIIEFAIDARRLIAAMARFGKPFLVSLIDCAIVVGTILIATYVRSDRFFSYPSYAYPWVFVVPSLVVVLSLYSAGVYSYRKLSISRSFSAVLVAYVVISALTAFLKHYAFGRVIVVISGGLSVLMIPGWRLIVRLMGAGDTPSRKTLFGRRTLIVGVENGGQEVMKKLRNRPGEGYSVVGFIDTNRQRLGQKILGVEILGSVDTIGKVINDYRISDVIFSADTIPYSTILSVISRSRNRMVDFKLVPNSLEVIIGRTRIDQLDEIPFIELQYNIDRTGNRISKRAVDILVSLFLLISCVPFVYFIRLFSRSQPSAFSSAMLAIPKVLRGSMSLIGRPHTGTSVVPSLTENGIYLGKFGVTGIVQVHSDRALADEEREQYELYYAKNQSLMLDFEIFLKAVVNSIRRTA
jgi:GT2 family glycosyltransferase/lipopolysaccharide/colanic/teichoic acid biosynthesis glycosyltransferase